MAKLLTALLALGLAGLAAADYCSVCSDHTMCKFTSTKAAGSCKGFQWKALSDADKKAVVNTHNELRNKVALGQESRGTSKQPSASNMRKMAWSEELATIAQRWANQCNFAHDTCRDTLDKQYVGQNIFWTASSGPLGAVDWSQAVSDWYSEVDGRDGNDNTVAFRDRSGPVTGHYTQVTWAETTEVGCGYADYQSVQGGRNWYSRLIVCNYKTGGNFIGKVMYQAGKPASKCPAGTKQDSTYKGLCA